MIAGHKEFLLAIRSRQDSRFGFIGTFGEKLQSQKRMRGPAFSQVNLDRVPAPIFHSSRAQPQNLTQSGR